jgi:hypothetical protein
MGEDRRIGKASFFMRDRNSLMLAALMTTWCEPRRAFWIASAGLVFVV